MEAYVGGEATEAKRGRYYNARIKHEVAFEEDYELELHQSGPVDDFGLDDNENAWAEEEDEEHVKVEARNAKEEKDLLPATSGKTSNRPESTDSSDRSRLKRPFEGHVANFEKETDPLVISRRTKQLEYGKNTPEYFNYLQAVPKNTRQPCHPKTPNKFRKYSRRAWDGIVRQWRINLHCWSDFQMPAGDQLAVNEAELEKLNESFTSEASGSTSTTSSVAAAFSAELGFLDSKTNHYSSRSASASESETELNTSGQESLNATVFENKSRQYQIKKAELEKTLLSTSWADEVEEYYDSDKDEGN